MEFYANLRQFNKAQTNKNGNIRKDKKGNDVHVTYVDMKEHELDRMFDFMIFYILPIHDFIKNTNYIEYFNNKKIDVLKKTRIGIEPVPYNYLQRLLDVSKRLMEKDKKDMTLGFLDSYNYLVDIFYDKDDNIKISIVNKMSTSFVKGPFKYLKEDITSVKGHITKVRNKRDNEVTDNHNSDDYTENVMDDFFV